MSLQQLIDQIPDFGKDIRLNLNSILVEESGLTKEQVAGTALASAYATRNKQLIEAFNAEYIGSINEATANAAKAAATIMAMNNIYYRAIHLMSEKEYQHMPARLRMNVIGNPGVDKVDFEIYSLAVSAINGCGMCIDTHAAAIEKHDVNKQAIQHALRIAAVVNAAAQALSI